MKSNTKLSLQYAQEIARNKKGKCLSANYINIDVKLKWVCEIGHQFDASLYNVKNRRTWCPKCAKRAKQTIEEMQALAFCRYGLCLSAQYINANTPLLWQCEFGHQWLATSSSIKNAGSWCPTCVGKVKLTIEEMHEIARLKEGKCLSTEYINNETPLQWECKFGHQWDAAPSSVKFNSWCPVCSGNVKLTIDYMNVLANKHHGKCLSTEYKNINIKLLWKCTYGHQWKSTPRDIQDGKWCKECHGSKRRGEHAVRNFFELIFNNKFPSSRPDWLKLEGKRIELDGYCKNLGLAFEYQGRYHFEEKAYWYPDKSVSFERRQLIDAHKRKACIANDVTLVEIYELDPRKNPEEWKENIRKSLESSRVKIPENFDSIPFGPKEFYTSKNYLAEANKIAQLKKGYCLSKSIIFNTQSVEWECNKGHRWFASLRQIVSKNTWCPYCAGKVKLTIDQMCDLASLQEGTCLSKTYSNCKTKLLWECKYGHQWSATPSSIKSGSWCPTCAKNTKLTLEDMHALATLKEGKCLSVQYNNSKTKLLWECKYQHQWYATSSSIKSGAWCVYCAKNVKLTLESMHELAKLKEGRCLASEYKNANTKLLWECKKGHKWFASPSKIKYAGRWCKKCKINK